MAEVRTTLQKIKRLSGFISMVATAGIIITTVIRRLRKKE